MNTLINRLWKAKGPILVFVGGFWVVQRINRGVLLNYEVFGKDGNGGKMLKILTDLTDEEIARLKFARRINWHHKLRNRTTEGQDVILEQEFSDRGIYQEQEPFISYEKRPPHDKYL